MFLHGIGQALFHRTSMLMVDLPKASPNIFYTKWHAVNPQPYHRNGSSSIAMLQQQQQQQRILPVTCALRPAGQTGAGGSSVPCSGWREKMPMFRAPLLFLTGS